MNEISVVKSYLLNNEGLFKSIDANAYDSFYHEICSKESNDKPSILIYGQYSNGKSTLVNAILGKEVAKVDINPTTYKIDKYLWEDANLYLVDCPGISAKFDHTDLAKSEASKNELVAFVVETGCLETGLVWDEMALFLKEEQKLCVIINDFDNCMDDPVRLEKIKDKFRENIQKAAEKANIATSVINKVPFFVINLKFALKAKLTNNEKFLKKSQIFELEHELSSLAHSVDINDVKKTVIRNFNSLIMLCKTTLANSTNDGLLKNITQHYNQLVNTKQEFIDNVNSEIDSIIDSHYNDFSSIFNSSSVESVTSKLSKLADDISFKINASLEELLASVSKELVENQKHFVDKISVYAPNELLDAGNIKDSPQSLTECLAKNDVIKSFISSVDYKELIRKGTEEVLKQLKNIFPALFKGIGKARIGTFAAALSKWAGPAVTIISAIYSIYSSFKEEEENRLRAQRKAAAIGEAINNTMNGLKQAYKKEILKVIDNFFETIIRPIAEKKDLYENQFSNITEKVNKLTHIEEDLKNL